MGVISKYKIQTIFMGTTEKKSGLDANSCIFGGKNVHLIWKEYGWHYGSGLMGTLLNI